MYPINTSSHIYGSRNVSKRGQWCIHPWYTKIQAVGVLEKSRSIFAVSFPCFPCLFYNRRMQFTEEDEEKLCEWIATKIPYKEIGGRTGNRLYQQLCDLVCCPSFVRKFPLHFFRLVNPNTRGSRGIPGNHGEKDTRRTLKDSIRS